MGCLQTAATSSNRFRGWHNTTCGHRVKLILLWNVLWNTNQKTSIKRTSKSPIHTHCMYKNNSVAMDTITHSQGDNRLILSRFQEMSPLTFGCRHWCFPLLLLAQPSASPITHLQQGDAKGVWWHQLWPSDSFAVAEWCHGQGPQHNLAGQSFSQQ